MHCEHCKRHVEKTVNNITGVAGAVNLKREEGKMSHETEADDEWIKRKVERLGYTVSNI